jgi:hypothetical protein
MSMARVSAQLVIPMGFTLTVSGVFVASLSRWPQPDFVAVWLFGGGAIAAHSVMVFAFRKRIPSAPRSWEGTLIVNVVPLVAIPLAVAGSEWITDPRFGFFASGALTVAIYVTGLGGYFIFLDRLKPTQHQESRP